MGTTVIIGIDLAWGQRKPDGVAVIEYKSGKSTSAKLVSVGLSHGDDTLLELAKRFGKQPTFLAIDAPLICVNKTGSRSVDKLTHKHFGAFHAGCYPASLKLTPRPPALLEKLRDTGFVADWDLDSGQRLVAEVYPHPAMVRWFGLSRILKYKRPPKANRVAEFARYQRHMTALLSREFGYLDSSMADGLLTAEWTKDIEDQLDGFFCALIGLWHVYHRGTLTEILGERDTGFIIVPKPNQTTGAPA